MQAGSCTPVLMLPTISQTITVVPVEIVAPRQSMIFPPVEYDHYYEGDLTIRMVNTIEELRAACNIYSNQYLLACSILRPTACLSIIVKDEVMRTQVGRQACCYDTKSVTATDGPVIILASVQYSGRARILCETSNAPSLRTVNNETRRQPVMSKKFGVSKRIGVVLLMAAALALTAPAKAGSLEANIVLYFAHCTDERMPVALNALVSSQFDDAYSPLNLTDTLVAISRQEGSYASREMKSGASLQKRLSTILGER
jgi:hypothetical protein